MSKFRAGFCGQWPGLMAARAFRSIALKSWVFRFLPVLLFALLLTPVTGGSEMGLANAQMFQTKAQRARYNRKVRARSQARRGARTRARTPSKPKKSLFGTLFGSKPSTGNSAKPFQGLKSLFEGFQGTARPRPSPASLRAAYEKRMREAARRKGLSVNERLFMRSGGAAAGWGGDLSRAGQAGYSRRAIGQYRTMCVRMCDGYYFPVSFKASSNQFGTDTQFCNSDCYNAPTKLFYYANPGGSIENMRALDGVLYKDIANAFKYRKEYVTDCRCKAEPWSRRARQQHESWGLERQSRANEALKTTKNTPRHAGADVDMSSASRFVTSPAQARY